VDWVLKYPICQQWKNAKLLLGNDNICSGLVLLLKKVWKFHRDSAFIESVYGNSINHFGKSILRSRPSKLSKGQHDIGCYSKVVWVFDVLTGI
jgi:hypothetical protein